MKHTPGPWEARHCSDGYGVFSDRVMVARIDNTVGEFNQEMVNANLIASAPELLEALKNLVELTQEVGTNIHNYKGAIDIAKQAIAKAEGN